MRIRKQNWLEMPDYIQIVLKEPYFSAFQKYGWFNGTWGLGVSMEAIRYGFKSGKKLRIRVLKYGKWEITPHMAFRHSRNQYGALTRFVARDGKELVIIPVTACKKIEKSKAQILEDDRREDIRTQSIQQALL